MNFSTMSSLVSHRTSRPAFFFPSDSMKGVAPATKSDQDPASSSLREGCTGSSNEFRLNSIFTSFATKAGGSSCPTSALQHDRTLKAEGSHHALKFNMVNAGGRPIRSFCDHIGNAESGSETRNLCRTHLSSPVLRSCCGTSNAKATVSENGPVSSVPSISPAELVELFSDRDSVAVVDCRSFMVFNANHIKGALNVNLANKITRKRFVDGHLLISDLVSGCEGKAEYKCKEQTAAIVVYDDNTVDLSSLPAAHPLKLLVNRLKTDGRDARYLEGGIQFFQTNFSQYCEHPDAQPNPPLLYSPTSQDVDAAVDTAKASEILPFLYVGNERDASSEEILKELGITHILNITAHIPFHFEDRLTCKRLQASDSGSQNLKQYFEEAIHFIESARVSNGRVMVHCQAGVSRSPTIAMAYIMARFGKSMQDTFSFMHNRRSIISPNLNFMGQLLEFGQRDNLSSLFETPLSCEYLQLTTSN